MSDGNLDAAILAQCQSAPRKVAMVVARVADESGEEDPERIGAHIARLVASGKLAADGDPTDWRHSEVSLPKAP